MAGPSAMVLRMQKELKMLEQDPAHGICAWPKDGKLNLLESTIQGPSGTPYEKGIFRLEVVIGDRYPFEPPKIRFITPIYHPNIDNGGRICLNILTMPPKGGWKPVLNISTVLTSIQALISEPNPDDGLMPEITNEYRYNRSKFNETAKNWTRQHANEIQNSQLQMKEEGFSQRSLPPRSSSQENKPSNDSPKGNSQENQLTELRNSSENNTPMNSSQKNELDSPKPTKSAKNSSSQGTDNELLKSKSSKQSTSSPIVSTKNESKASMSQISSSPASSGNKRPKPVSRILSEELPEEEVLQFKKQKTENVKQSSNDTPNKPEQASNKNTKLNLPQTNTKNNNTVTMQRNDEDLKNDDSDEDFDYNIEDDLPQKVKPIQTSVKKK